MGQYHDRFRGPYRAALPTRPTDRPRPVLYALPGSADWEDGLTSFLRQFCRGGNVGGWATQQTNSYFALRLRTGSPPAWTPDGSSATGRGSVLRRVPVQNVVVVVDRSGRELIRLREADTEGLPPGRSRIVSPYDTDARWGDKRDLAGAGTRFISVKAATPTHLGPTSTRRRWAPHRT
jgi:hypothetical protein